MAKDQGRTASVSSKSSKAKATKAKMETASYAHQTADAAMRPDVGTQAQFKKKKEPVVYRYDSSLSSSLEWDGQNPSREIGEAHLAQSMKAHVGIAKALEELEKLPADGLTDAQRKDRKGAIAAMRAALQGSREALQHLKAMSGPFLNWSGKAERLSFEVPTLPLFVHERLSTAAIIDTLRGHKKDQQMMLFADPQRSIADQVLKAYEHRDQWTNRMILGDSLAVMNSLVHYESMGGQVQMIYMDPPYGVKFGSNFQPFVRKRDVSHNDDEDMTREPEMVKAYRDTWELGLHSYLTYMRDRLTLSRELLAPTGSIFVQISDENLHHVRELMDEVFGAENFVSVIAFYKTTGQASTILPQTKDFLIWYARDREHLKYRQLYVPKQLDEAVNGGYDWVEDTDGNRRPMTQDDRRQLGPLLDSGWRVCALSAITSSGALQKQEPEFTFAGETWRPPTGSHWKTTVNGLEALRTANRLGIKGNSLRYVRYFNDFPVFNLSDVWTDVAFGGFVSNDKLYVVQTAERVVQRCILMTTDPGDLVLDPTCGSGTSAYVAEQWGRRWITADVSRVPLALARQRLLTATFPWYELRDDSRGPAAGFVYKRKQNQKGEEVGGIVPHVTLKSIANNEPADEEVLVDRPEEVNKITRVCGPFCFEATIPAGMSGEDSKSEIGDSREEQAGEGYVQRMIEILRKSPVLRLEGNRTITLRNVRVPAKTLSLSAEAVVEGHVAGSKLALDEAVQVSKQESGLALPFAGKPVAFVFGPENGAVSEKLVYEAAKEGSAKSYAHLYVIGFAIQANARQLVEECERVVGIPATYVQATPDLLMGDLLKNMRSSQIFSVCGMPEIEIKKAAGKKEEPEKWQVKLLGVDVFDPIAIKSTGRSGNDVPAWFLDTDYNGLCFHVCQAFFPRTSAWENLKKALRGTYEESVWDHLAGDTSAPFEPGEHKQIAVKVVDDRGNELMVVKGL